MFLGRALLVAAVINLVAEELGELALHDAELASHFGQLGDRGHLELRGVCYPRQRSVFYREGPEFPLGSAPP